MVSEHFNNIYEFKNASLASIVPLEKAENHCVLRIVTQNSDKIKVSEDIENFRKFENATTELSKMIQSAINARAKNWTYMALPENGHLISCQIEDKSYILKKTNTLLIEKEEKTLKTIYSLTINNELNTEKHYRLTKKEYDIVVSKINKVIMPVIERYFAIGQGFNLSGVFTFLIKQAGEGKLQCSKSSSRIDFQNGYTITVSNSVEAYIDDKKKLVIFERPAALIDKKSELFVCLEISDRPKQLIRPETELELELYYIFKKLLAQSLL
jgi:hypothetical protein